MYKSSTVFSLLICIVLVSSCYDEDNTYGKNLVNSAFRSVATDTSTITISSILMDSLETTGKELILTGHYPHPYWGTILASSYIPYSRASYPVNIDKVVTLDSIVLQLYSNNYFIGDTTQLQRYYIHRLTEKIVLNDNGYLYNVSTVEYDPTPIGSFTFTPKPNDSIPLEIRLEDSLGEELLYKFHNRDDDVSSDRFEDYFKGLAIIPDETISQSIQGYQVNDSSAVISLYYTIEKEEENENVMIFKPNTSTQFNHIVQDYSDSSIDPTYRGETEIPSDFTNDKGFIMGGTGWLSKLEFPYLNNILQQGEIVEINEAILFIYPEVNSYSSYNALPDSIYLYIADENNVVTNAVTDYLGQEVQSGTLVKDEIFRENTYYYFDITNFLQQELGTIGMYKHNLQLVFDSNNYTQTIKNMTFDNQRGENPIVLQLRYKIYEAY